MEPKSPSRRRTPRKRPRNLNSAVTPLVRLVAAILAVAAVGAAVGCGGGAPARAGKSQVPGAPPIAIVPNLTLAGRGRALEPARFGGPWLVSFDVRLAPGTRLDVGLGSVAFELRRGPSGPPVLSSSGALIALPHMAGWLASQWRHVEVGPSRLAIDGRQLPLARAHGRTLVLGVSRGRAQIQSLIVSGAEDRASLLLHRLAELHARLAPGVFPIGADLGDHLHNSSSYWTSGFWPGALWQAAALEPAGSMFAHWALSATIAHLGRERADTHDVGFMYGQSSLAAWQALCRGGATHPSLCARLRRSALGAANELVALASSNRRAGTIPTNSLGPDADTIVDSMMNAAALLPWASKATGNPAYARVASRHADRVASLLVRPDGSTAQAVNFDRGTGRVLSIATHQGLSKNSTWSRGQAWAVYGFAQLAAALGDPSLLRVAERAAAYVSAHLPAGGIPRWDYDAPAGAPVDVSAGVITAAGLFHLAAACKRLAGVCADPGRWVSLGRRMLAAALTRVSDRPPLGFLGSQVLNEHGRGCWCNGGELSFGLTYALEALRLERAA